MSQLESYHLWAFERCGERLGVGEGSMGTILGNCKGDHREELYLAIIKPQIKNVKHTQTNEKSKV